MARVVVSSELTEWESISALNFESRLARRIAASTPILAEKMRHNEIQIKASKAQETIGEERDGWCMEESQRRTM